MLKVGKILGPHGLHGHVNVESYTQNPLDIGKYGALYDSDSNVYTIQNIREGNKGLRVLFTEVQDRNASEAVKGVELYIKEEALPEVTNDEVFYKDLIGLSVESDGKVVGTVKAVHNFGAGDIIEVVIAEKSVMLPFEQCAITGDVLKIDKQTLEIFL